MRIGLDYISSEFEKFANVHPYLNGYYHGEPEEILNDSTNYPILITRLSALEPVQVNSMKVTFDLLVLDQKIDSEAKTLSDTGFVFTELNSTYKLDNEDNFGFFIKSMAKATVSKDENNADIIGWYTKIEIIVHNYESDFQSAISAVELTAARTVVRPLDSYSPEELLQELTEYQLDGVQLFQDMSTYTIQELFNGLTLEQIAQLQLTKKATEEEAKAATLNGIEYLTPYTGKVSVLEHAQNAKYTDADANEITIQQALHNLKIAIDDANDERVDVLLENAPNEVNTLLKIYNLINANDLALNNSISNIQLALNSPEETLDDLAEIVLFIQRNKVDLDNYIIALNNKVDKEIGKSLASDAEKALWADKYNKAEIDTKFNNIDFPVLFENVGLKSISTNDGKGNGQITFTTGSDQLTGIDTDFDQHIINDGMGEMWFIHNNSVKNIYIQVTDATHATILYISNENGQIGTDGTWNETTVTLEYYYKDNFAIGKGGWAIGEENLSKYNYSFAFGEYNKAMDNHAFAFGYRNIAGDNHAFAFGDGNNASYDHAIAFGEDNTVNRSYSVAFGYDNLIDSYYSVAQGSYNEIYQDYSFGMGRDNILNGYMSFAFGDGNTVNSRYSAILGGTENTIGLNSNYSGIGGGQYINVPENKPNTWFSHILNVGGGKEGAAKIEFWNDVAEGTLSWNPTANRTLTLPDADGVIAIKDNIIIDSQDIEGDVIINLANKDVFHLTLTGDITSFDVINAKVGKNYKIYTIQDATGNRTISGFTEKFKFENNVPILLSDEVGIYDLLQLDVVSAEKITIYPIYDI